MFELERGRDDPFRPTVMAVLDESDISARGSEQALTGSWSSCATRRAAMFSGVNSQVATATTRPTPRFIWSDRMKRLLFLPIFWPADSIPPTTGLAA